MTLIDDDAPAGLTIGVLGPLTVHRGGERVALGGRREAAVLVALVLAHGRVVSVDALVEAVWPDSRPAGPLPTLQAHISHLRKRLDPAGAPGRRGATIERVGNGYALRVGTDAVDAWRFESLIAAADRGTSAQRVALLSAGLALWRGAALAGFADEQWARPAAERWSELQNLARERLFAARLEQGESAVLVAELEDFVAQAPLREERWRLLVLALYRAHRQGDALAALRRVRELLADELGVDPGPALRSLEAEVLAQADSLHVAPPGVAPHHAESAAGPPPSPGDRSPAAGSDPLGADPGVTSPVPPATGVRENSFPGAGVRGHGPRGDAVRGDGGIVDRDRELAIIGPALAGAERGDGQLVLIEGPAGIGKTHLLREIRTHAGPARVLGARGSTLEREYGFGVVRQLFEPLVAASNPDTLFGGAAAAAAAVFRSHPNSPAGGDTLFGVLHGLYWLTAELAASTPVLITVDDVQWCDVGSLRFLGFLAHRLEGLPVALVVTLRTGEHHDTEDLLTEIISEPGVLVVTPRPLSSAGVAELVRGRLGDDPDEAFVAACRRTTGGNPLLLRQLLRALESDGIRPTAANVDTVRAIGSRAVSSLVLRRFTRMPTPSRAAARAVAILGDGATLPLVAALAELPQPVVAEAIGALARAEVLRDDYPLDFVHPLVRDAVYGDIPLGTREIQHERAARLLDAAGAPVEQVAAQVLKSPPHADPETVALLMTAAARSVTRGAPDGAATYLQRALIEPPTPDLLPQLYLELGRVETMTAVPSALEHLTAAYQRLTDVRQRAQAAVMLGRVEIFASRRGHSRETAESVIRELGPEHVDERQWLQAMSRISMHMHALGAPPDEQPEIIGTGPGARSLAAALAWEASLAGVDRQRSIDLARFALTGDTLDDVDQAFLGVVARNTLNVADAAPANQWDDALAKAYHRGSLFAVLGAQIWGGYAHWIHGSLDEAEQWLRNCTEQNDIWGAPQIAQTYTDAFLVEVLLDRGDLAAATAFLAVEQPYWGQLSEGHAFLETARARVLFESGRLDDALEVLDRVAELSQGVTNPGWRSWPTDRAVVLAARGDREQAIALLHTELQRAQRWGAPRAIGRTLRLLGSVQGADGLDLLRSAVEVLEPSSAWLELAKARAALGGALSGGGSAAGSSAPSTGRPAPSAEAAETLVAAYELAAECGAAGLRDRVRDQLIALGLPVPMLPERRTLTTTERRIVEMSLDGAFDQEIAQALFITPPTVRQTLEGVRRRLGATSPQQLRLAVASG